MLTTKREGFAFTLKIEPGRDLVGVKFEYHRSESIWEILCVHNNRFWCVTKYDEYMYQEFSLWQIESVYVVEQAKVLDMCYFNVGIDSGIIYVNRKSTVETVSYCLYSYANGVLELVKLDEED